MEINQELPARRMQQLPYREIIIGRKETARYLDAIIFNFCMSDIANCVQLKSCFCDARAITVGVNKSEFHLC